MKRALLLVTAAACLSTSGIAYVFADKATTSAGSHTLRGEGGAMTDMDEVGEEHFRGGEGGLVFQDLDRNDDGFLNAQELNAYGATAAGNQEQSDRGAELVQQLDQDGDRVITPAEFQEQERNQGDR